MRIYLDTCSIQRPLDTLSQTRVRLEAEAILSVLERIEIGEVELVSSTVSELEILQNPLAVRREHGEQILARSTSVIIVDETIEKRAHEFVQQAVKAMDALHLAAAESGGVDYFCSCDDSFLHKAKNIIDLRTTMVSPLELFEVLERK